MKNWLNDAVVYEIYPQSFYDTNGDGIGDLPGIIEKLDYIESCGFNVIWLHPINPSPFRDAGYDVTDFYDVAPRYGTLDDYRALCKEAHRRGMKVVFDLVAGHTSIDHPWFVQSGKVEENEYTNRYIWTVPTFEKGDGVAALGERDQKCISNFFWSQPALNYGYANPDPDHPWELPVTHPDCVATKNELLRIINFWIDQGADAFRVDMAPSLIKRDKDKSANTALWHEIRAHVEAKNPECLLISEWGKPDVAINAGFHLDFLLHDTHPAYTSLFRHEQGRNTTSEFVGDSYFSREGKGDAGIFLDHFLSNLEATRGKGYIGLITGNHDMPRLAFRRTPEEIKAAMVFLFTMPGVPFVYYGDEIGMDYITGLPSKEGGYVRTGSRTPMQWSNGKNCGFSDSDAPYLPTDARPDAPTVEAQEQDEQSLLSLVKALTAYHRTTPALWADGEFRLLLCDYPLVYERSGEGKTVFVAINPSAEPREYTVPKLGKVLFSQNVEQDGDRLLMGGVSFLVAEEL